MCNWIRVINIDTSGRERDQEKQRVLTDTEEAWPNIYSLHNISDNQKGYPHCRGMAVVIRIVPFSCNFFFIDRDKWNFFRYLEKKKNAIRNKLSFLARRHYVSLFKGATWRNLWKIFREWEVPPNWVKHEKKTLKKKGINNTTITKEGKDRQTWRRLKRIAIVVFSKLVSLTVFQSAFLLFVTFHIMLADQNCLTQSCDFVSYKKFICWSQVP